MTNWNALYRGVSRAAWGYFFLHFNVNLGSVNILPEFVGYLLLLSAVDLLKEERRDLGLLKPLAILLSVWNGLDWLLTIFGVSLGGALAVVSLVISLTSLYFHFQLLTDMAALATRYQHQDGLDKWILRLRTANTVLLTASTLAVHLSEWLPDWWAWAVYLILIPLLVVCICIMAALFKLRKCFRGETPEGLPL